MLKTKLSEIYLLNAETLTAIQVYNTGKFLEAASLKMWLTQEKKT